MMITYENQQRHYYSYTADYVNNNKLVENTTTNGTTDDALEKSADDSHVVFHSNSFGTLQEYDSMNQE